MPPDNRPAVLIGLTALLGSLSTVARRKGLLHLDPWAFGLVDGVLHSLLIPLYLYLIPRSGNPIEWAKGLPWVVAGTLLNVVCNMMFLWALRFGGSVGVVSLLAAASPVLSLSLAAALLGEVPTPRQALGVALILVGGFLVSRR